MAVDLTKGLVPIASEDGSPNVQYLGSLQNLIGKTGAGTGETGNQVFGGGVDALQSMLSHYTKLMSGSTGDIVNATPEIGSVLSQYDAARTSMNNLTPRGGMRASQGADLKFKELGDVGNLIQKTRQNAEAGASGTAQALTQAGLSEQNMSVQQIVNAMNSLLAQRGQNVESDTENKKLAGVLGSGLLRALV